VLRRGQWRKEGKERGGELNARPASRVRQRRRGAKASRGCRHVDYWNKKECHIEKKRLQPADVRKQTKLRAIKPRSSIPKSGERERTVDSEGGGGELFSPSRSSGRRREGRGDLPSLLQMQTQGKPRISSSTEDESPKGRGNKPARGLYALGRRNN